MDGSIVFARSHQCAPHLVHPNWYLHHTTVPLYSFKCHLVLLHSPAHKQLTHTRLVGWLVFNVPFQHKYGYIRDESNRLCLAT